MIEAFRRRWDEWRDLADEETLRVSFSPSHGLVVGVVLVGYALAGTHAPFLREVLALDARGFAFVVGPAWCLSMVLALAFRRSWIRGSHAIALPVVGSGLVMFEAGAMVAFASDRAAPALASLVALTALAHAHQGLSCARLPFVAVADAAGLLVVSLHATTDVQRMALLVSGVGGIVAGLLVGEATVRSVRARRHAERMRSALESQIAAQAVARSQQLEGLVVDAHARRHDVRNALMRALLDLELLEDTFRREERAGATELERAAHALRTGIELAQQPGPGTRRRLPVSVPSAIAPILEGLRARFPRARFELELQEEVPLLAHVEEGESGLRRIVENLLVNAAEGDGRRRATRVSLRVSRRADGEVTILRVSDDGPGFSSTQLAGDIHGFESTKDDGTGLGLFIVENLARASGGWVERANGARGGAIVTVSLPAGATHVPDRDAAVRADPGSAAEPA